MESTFVFSPAPRTFRILQSFQWKNKGYSVISLEEKSNTLLLHKHQLFFKKRTFEIKVSPTKENISSISVKQLLPEEEKHKSEQELIAEILKLF